MSLTIRDRGIKAFQATQERAGQGLEAIASAIGVSKSSVHRHQQGIERRNQYPESTWWETEAGSAWLKLLVVGSIFCFGIKHGIGVGELSQFLRALRLGLHVGCSPQTLKVLTIIHNFHLKRPDGTTAAQRLFGYDFPDLFEWVASHVGDLPLARRSQKAQDPNPFHLESFPA
jgi:hypothetical protein